MSPKTRARLHGRLVLLGRAVVGQEDQGHLLAVPGQVLGREVEVAGDVLDLVERGLGRRALEEEVVGVVVSARLADEGDHGLLDRDGRADAVRVRVVAEQDRLRDEDRPPDRLRDLAHLRPEQGHDLALDEQGEIGGLGPALEGLLDPRPDLVGLGARDDGERPDLDLDLGVAHHDLAVDLDDVAEVRLGVGPDAGLDEGGRVLGPGLVEEREDGRAAGLLDLRDLAHDRGRPADAVAELGELGRRDLLDHVADLVRRQDHLLEVDVAVRADLLDADQDLVALVMVGADVGLVDQALEAVGELDEGAEGGEPLYAPHVDVPDLDIGDVAGGAEAVDGDVGWTHMDRSVVVLSNIRRMRGGSDMDGPIYRCRRIG